MNTDSIPFWFLLSALALLFCSPDRFSAIFGSSLSRPRGLVAELPLHVPHQATCGNKNL